MFNEVRAAHIQFIRDRIQAAEGDLWQKVVVAGCYAFVESAAKPSVRRIVHTDGPAVLDWIVIQKRAPGLILLRDLFERLMAEGLVERRPLDPLMLRTAFFEARMYIAQADDNATAQKDMPRLWSVFSPGCGPFPSSSGRRVDLSLPDAVG